MNKFFNTPRGGERPRRIIAYIAGPYRDKRGPKHVLDNIMEAREVAFRLWLMEIATICPHTNAFLCDSTLMTDERILNGELDMLERCDIIVMMPRWKDSIGSMAELEHAKACGISDFYWDRAADHKFLSVIGPAHLKDTNSVCFGSLINPSIITLSEEVANETNIPPAANIDLGVLKGFFEAEADRVFGKVVQLKSIM